MNLFFVKTIMKTIEFKIHVEKGHRGNLLALDFSVEDNRVTLINIYGPNSDNFDENIRDVFLEFDNEYYILFGDLNVAINPLQDTHSYCGIYKSWRIYNFLITIESCIQIKKLIHDVKNLLKQGQHDFF